MSCHSGPDIRVFMFADSRLGRIRESNARNTAAPTGLCNDCVLDPATKGPSLRDCIMCGAGSTDKPVCEWIPEVDRSSLPPRKHQNFPQKQGQLDFHTAER